MTRRMLNGLAVQLNWFACVLGAARGVPWLGPLTTVLLVADHVRVARHRWRALSLLAAALVLGLAVDSTLTAGGWLRFPDLTAGPWPPLAPPWILGLWIALATTLDSSMAWLRGRYLLAAALGAIGGPMAYLAGERLGAVELATPLGLTYGALALAWGLSLPLLLALERLLGPNRHSEA